MVTRWLYRVTRGWVVVAVTRTCARLAIRRPRPKWDGIILPGFEMRLNYGLGLQDQRYHYGLHISYTRMGDDERARERRRTDD